MKKGDLVRVKSYKGYSNDSIGLIISKQRSTPGMPHCYKIYTKGKVLFLYKHSISQRLEYVEYLDGPNIHKG